MGELWIGVVYNLPAAPSRGRVYVWRKLKDLGAVYLRPGMALLPHSADNRRALTSLGQKIRALGGEATVLELRFCDGDDNEKLADAYRSQLLDSYRQLYEESQPVVRKLQRGSQKLSAAEANRLRKLLYEFERLRQTDFVYRSVTSEMEDGFNLLIRTLKETAGDFGKNLRETLHNLGI